MAPAVAVRALMTKQGRGMHVLRSDPGYAALAGAHSASTRKLVTARRRIADYHMPVPGIVVINRRRRLDDADHFFGPSLRVGFDTLGHKYGS